MKYLLAIALLCISQAAAAQELAPFDSALAQVGLNSADVRFDQDEMATWQGDLWRLSYFTLYHRNPFSLPKHADLIVEELSGKTADLVGLLAFAGQRADQPIRRGLIGDQLEPYIDADDSLSKFSICYKRNVLTGNENKTLRDAIDLFYRVVDDEDNYFRVGIEEIDKNKYRDALWQYLIEDSSSRGDEIEELYAKVDMGRMVAGAEDIAEALKRLAEKLPDCAFPDYVVKIGTSHGDIIVGTAGDDRFEYIQAPLLIVDGGGNDVYSFPGQNEERPIAAIVDLAGNDRYISEDSTKPGIGGGLISLSYVLDLAGDDSYRGQNVCQGAGVFGVGAVIDKAGNDTYSGRYLTQGAGAFGLGVLSDQEGDDSLYCWSMSQGFGYSRGCGLLLDGAGDDVYIAEDDTIFSAASQNNEHNNSLAQGVGFGRRADFIDGHSWAGGVGILCDLSGNDRYSSGLFAQGCAYWFSVGMLIDAAGDDTHEGVWYVMGSGAHFAVGYLDDFAGDDIYAASHNMAVGAGHDFTIGYFNERSGNDKYTVPNLSLGGGNANGIGIFHDHAGDDVYTTKTGTTTLGRANSIATGIRSVLACFGVFVDGGGNDSYSEDWAANGARWLGPVSDSEHPNPTAIGVGIDF
ncbi:hypothetical protein KQH82_10175 [bacterium]|nr:hypothetical protein [bacterium]